MTQPTRTPVRLLGAEGHCYMSAKKQFVLEFQYICGFVLYPWCHKVLMTFTSFMGEGQE